MWIRMTVGGESTAVSWQGPCFEPPAADPTMHLEMHPTALSDDLERYVRSCAAGIEDAAPGPVRCRVLMRRRPATVLQEGEYEAQVWVDMPTGVVAVVHHDRDAFRAARHALRRTRHHLDQIATENGPRPSRGSERLAG